MARRFVDEAGQPVDEPQEAIVVVDNCQLPCVEGILQLKQTMLTRWDVSTFEVISTDLAAERDYPAWCRRTGQVFVGHQRETHPRWGTVIVSIVRRGGDVGAR